MHNRILINVVASKDCISFKTMSRSRKSPHWFYVLRSKLAELEHKSKIIVHDINSFAILYRDSNTGTIEIDFTWLSGDKDNITGYQETVILPYDKLMAFVYNSATEGSSATWKALSIDNSKKHPKIVFKSRKNLHNVIVNRILRHKLIRSLRDSFNWPSAERIELYDDYIPYSFTFREIKNEKLAISGGLILHGQDNIEKAYYSIHT